MGDDTPLQFGRFRWHGVARQLLVDGEPAALGARALDLLAVLVEQRDRVVGKQELLDRVWPALVVEENNLQVQVSALRKVLGPELITTVPGRGYRFNLAAAGARPAALPPGLLAPNLAPDPGPLVGRDDDLRRLHELLLRSRLVSLVGPGGVGKTRLALAAAATVAEQWRDGVRLLEAADIGDAALLPRALASVLQIGDAAAADTAAGVADALRGQSLLLVLDNCEHLVDAAAQLVQAILAQAPQVHLLVTSQLRLNLAAEQVLPLAPLALPPPDETRPDERYAAVQLFVRRAQAVQPDFALGPDNAAVVADICRRLDGLPLAIELAAARVRLLGVQGLRDRLDDRLRLLTAGARDAPPRQRALQAALDWSHALLDDTERAVLRRVSVFVGGFTLELAQQVAADDRIDDWAVLDALGGLVEKSLVAVDAGERPRYRLLESTRAFAWQRLAEAGEAPTVARRHAQALCTLFVRLDALRFDDDGGLDADTQRGWLVPEIGNARAALAWAMAPGGDRVTAVALAAASANVFMQLGLTLEALPRLQALRTSVDERLPAPQVADFWRRLAMLGAYGGMAVDSQHEACRLAIEWARRAGSRRRLHAALAHWGHFVLSLGQVDTVGELLHEMQGLERDHDPPYVPLGRLGLQSAWQRASQRYDESVATLERQAALALASGETLSSTLARTNLAWTLNVVGRHAEAAELALQLLADPALPRGLNVVTFELVHALSALGRVDEALELAQKQRRHWHLSPLVLHAAAGLARLAAAQGRLDDAWRIIGAGAAACSARGLPVDALADQVEQHLRHEAAAAGIDDAQCRRWKDEGQALDDAALVALALRDGG